MLTSLLTLTLLDVGGPGLLIVGLGIVIGALILIVPAVIALIIAIVNGIKKRNGKK